MALLPDYVWERHANAWSGWTRVLSMPALGIGLYMHNVWVLGLLVLWIIVNPFVFPKPKCVNNWMSKGVIGERLYFKNGKKIKKDLPTLLNIANIPVFVSFVYFGWQQMLVPLVLSGLLTMVIKFWFIDRMALLADRQVY